MLRELQLKLDKAEEWRIAPMLTFFSVVPDEDFVKMLELISKGIGFGYNDANCTFADDLYPWEEPFEGVEFKVVKDAVIVSFKEMYDILSLAVSVYIKDNPQDREKATQLQQEFFDRFCRQ